MVRPAPKRHRNVPRWNLEQPSERRTERTMDKNSAKKEIRVLGIDTGKNSFHLHGVDAKGHRVLRKHFNREKMLEFMVNLKPCLVGIEACGGSHHLARQLKGMGHDVRMMAPQFVKPYVKSNKNDKLDAEAICEAVQRPSMRFVPIKSIEQQDLQSLHRIRSKVVADRTSLINQIRGLLMEYGIILPKGPDYVRRQLPRILEDTGNGTTVELREMLGQLREELVHMDERIAGYNAKIEVISQQNESCKLLMSIPGIGPLIATALIAAVGDVRVFKNGRELAAWLGLVPRQNSTGGKTTLLGISKRGDSYLRMLLVHGARAALIHASKKDDRLSRWVTNLEERRGWNIATVALAARNVRIAWALLSKGEAFKASKAVS